MKPRLLVLLAVCAAVSGVSEAQSADELDALTARLREMRRGLPTPALQDLVRTRAERLRRVMETDPRRAIEAALGNEEADGLRALAPGLIEVSGQWEGALEVRIEDDFSAGVSRTRYMLDTGTEEIEVFPAEPLAEPGCFPQVSVEGVRLAAAVATGEIQVRAAGVGCSLTGTQNTIVILVTLSGAALPSQITSSFVNNAFFGSFRSVSTFWQENSFGSVNATGQVVGPFAISATSCGSSSTIRSQAIAAADPSVNFTQYSRVFIIMSNVGSCGIGLGTIGCSNLSSADGTFTASTAWLRADYLSTESHLISVGTHEGGHNMGLEHASTQDFGAVPLGAPGVAGTYQEYWDVFSAMGLSLNAGGTIVIGHYNAPHKAQLGWIASGSRYQNVTSSGTFTLQPYGSSSAGLKAIRVQRPGTNKWLWLEYRQSVGQFENTLASYGTNIYNGVLIHHEDPNESHYPQSLLLDFTPTGTPNDFRNAALASGSSWTDPSTGLVINVVSASASSLTVSITIGGGLACDLNTDGSVNILDVQVSVNKALGLQACGNGDLDGNGSCNIVDLQRVITAALGGACVQGP